MIVPFPTTDKSQMLVGLVGGVVHRKKGYYFHIYLLLAFNFPSQSLRAVISVPLPLSSNAIISSSCTFSIAHCLTEELELSKEKTDYLLFSKITTRLFPV